MLSVANLNTWNNYFKQTAIKNCDVHIYNSAGTLLLDKGQMESFNLTMRNCYVCKEIPSDVCLIKINKWAELSNAKKTYLSTKGNCVKVSYFVEGEETTTCKPLAINKITIDRLGKNATLELVNPLEQKTEINEFIYGDCDPNESGGSFYYGSKAVSGAYPLNTTTAECIQLFALDKSISTAKGYRIASVGKNIPFNFNTYLPYDDSHFKDFNKNDINGTLFNNNIFDYENTLDDDGNDNIRVYGATKSQYTTVLRSPNFDTPYVNNTWDGYLPTEIKIEYVNAYCPWGDSPVSAYYHCQLFSNKVHCWFPTDPYDFDNPPLWYTVQYWTLELEPIDNGVENYIQSKAFMQENTLAIQTSIRNYYSNKEMISIKCRMNPIFEPLDIIQTKLDDRLINIALEEVTINFNGGFTGSIKGRIVWELTSLVAPTVQFNINEQNFVDSINDSYNFVVTNSNPVAVDMVFANEDSEVITKVSIPANSTVTLYSTTDLNNDLDEYVRARNIELYGYFECEEIQSSSVLVLETRSIIPPTVTSSVYGNTFDITVKNDNLYEVYLNIDYSGGTLQEIIPPYSTRQFNQNDLPELIASAEAYDDSQLANAVSCYFENSDYGFTSTTVMIWEADV